MYEELYNAWMRELDSMEIERLPPDFYPRVADYVKRLKEESRMLDKRTLKANLLRKEMRNVKRLIRELLDARYRKIVKSLAKGQKPLPDLLTPEEGKIFSSISFAENFKNFARDLMQGYLRAPLSEPEHKRSVLRFLQSVPAIIGADMKTYGPFRVEDVASLPVENAKALIKQGLAEKLEI